MSHEITSESELLKAAITEIGRKVDPHITGSKHVHLRVAAVRRVLAAARETTGGPTDAFHLSCPSCSQSIDLIPADSARNRPQQLGAALSRLDSLERENAHLRVVAQKVGCPYGHLSDSGACELGYPGCACMDDLLATMAWCPADEEKAAVRLGKRLQEVEASLSEAREVVRALMEAWPEDSVPAGPLCVRAANFLNGGGQP